MDNTSEKILRCLVEISKDEKYQSLSHQRDIIKEKLRQKKGRERLDLLIQDDNIANELKRRAEQIIISKMDGKRYIIIKQR